MNELIRIVDVTVSPLHRALKPWLVEQLTASMQAHGYNVAYPIVIDRNGTLVEGRHRLTAASAVGITEIPFIRKPDDVSSIRFGLQCNTDGQLAAADDVFDLAELCWKLSNEGMTGKDVAELIGWDSAGAVSNYKGIREKLHAAAWNLARFTTNRNSVNNGDDSVVNRKFTTVNWQESHFRAFLRELPCVDADRNLMRAQVAAIREILVRFADPSKKVTAAYCGEVAAKWRWFTELQREAFTRLSADVPLAEKKGLLCAIRQGRFGVASSDEMLRKFIEHVDHINGQVLRLWLVNGSAENLHFIADNTVDAIITSPPYNLGGNNWPMGGGGRQSRNGINYATHDDAMDQAAYEDWQLAVLRELWRVAKEGASLFYNHKVRTVDGRLISPMRWVDHPENPWILRQEIIWNRKSTHNHTESLFWQIDERVYWLTKGKPALTQAVGLPTIWEEFGPTPNTWHPAPFTEKLPQMLLDAIHIVPSSIVLDPFAGSCTTVKVALARQCQAIGVDITRDYLEKAAAANKWPASAIYTNDVRIGEFDGQC